MQTVNLSNCVFWIQAATWKTLQWNYLEGSDNLSDNSGHGTGVCEILLEKALDANLVMLKCFDGESENQTDDNTIIQAIYDSVDKYHADILNMSWTLNRLNLLHEANSVCQRKTES